MAEGDRNKVLALVAQGTLSIDQADQLLEAIAERDDGQRENRAEVTQRRVIHVGPDGTEVVQPIPPIPPVPPVQPVPPRARIVMRRAADKVSMTPSFDQLIQLAIHGIKPDFVRRVHEAGLQDLSLDQVVQLGIHGVDPEWLRDVRASGTAEDFTFDQLIQMRIHGVRPGQIKEWKRLADEGIAFRPDESVRYDDDECDDEDED